MTVSDRPSPEYEEVRDSTLRISSPMRGPLRFFIRDRNRVASPDSIERSSLDRSEKIFNEHNAKNPVGLPTDSRTRYLRVYSNGRKKCEQRGFLIPRALNKTSQGKRIKNSWVELSE